MTTKQASPAIKWRPGNNLLHRQSDERVFDILPVCWENRLWRRRQVSKNCRKRYVCEKLKTFLLRAASELIISLKRNPLNSLTENNHHWQFATPAFISDEIIHWFSIRITPFSGNYACMNFMMKVPAKDNSFAHFSDRRWCLTNRKADTSAERTGQAK